MSIAMIILGINSFIFHATMRHTTQYADELSMFILAGSLLQGVFAINQSPAITMTVAFAILTTLSIMSAVYIRTGDILYHVKCFNSMTLIVRLQELIVPLLGVSWELATHETTS
jgi:dihydroceramidase